MATESVSSLDVTTVHYFLIVAGALELETKA